MSDTKIGHKIHEAAKPAPPKPVDKPANTDAPRPVAGPKETVALSAPEAQGGENTAHHDALKEAFGGKDDKAAGPNGETPRTPQQQRADIASDIKDIQGELKATKDPAEKKALEEELAALQGQLKDLDPQEQADGGEGPGEAGGPAAVGGAAPVTSNGGPRIQTPWVHQQSTRGGPGEGGRQIGSPSGPAPATNPSGDVKEWVAQAMQILAQEGVDMSKVREQDIYVMIQKESSGNPHAQNNWDSNAKKGTPSKGIMQTIDSTFNQFKAPGHGDIWNPVDNIVAAVKYSISRYGSTSNVPGIKSMGQGGAYKGY